MNFVQRIGATNINYVILDISSVSSPTHRYNLTTYVTPRYVITKNTNPAEGENFFGEGYRVEP